MSVAVPLSQSSGGYVVSNPGMDTTDGDITVFTSVNVKSPLGQIHIEHYENQDNSITGSDQLRVYPAEVALDTEEHAKSGENEPRNKSQLNDAMEGEDCVHRKDGDEGYNTEKANDLHMEQRSSVAKSSSKQNQGENTVTKRKSRKRSETQKHKTKSRKQTRTIGTRKSVHSSKGESMTLLVDGKTVESKSCVKAEGDKRCRKFQCRFCRVMPFNSEESLNKHIKRHNFIMLPNNKGLFECNECGKSFKTRANLTTHMWIHREKRFSCAECGKTFVQKVQLTVHISNVHNKEKPYLCSLCGKKYSQQVGLTYHLRTHRGEEVKDQVIKLIGSDKRSLIGNKAAVRCLVCKEQFIKVIRWLYHLEKHLQSNVSLEASTRENIEQILHDNELFMKSQKVYKCDLCDHISFYSSEHTLHKAIHEEGKPLQCPHCDKMFSHHSNLKYHVRRTHRRLRCHLCEARYGSVRELTEHQVAEHNLDMSLTGSPYYKCRRCLYQTKQKSRLLFHMSQIHNINSTEISKFNCKWCGKSFATKYSQQLHERTHTNERPYKCCSCSKTFSDPSNLIHHGIKSHPEIPKDKFFSRKS